ncbi:MAG TPA: transaldolase family protein [Gemmataceae bacterium]|jgi:transaldolase
MKMFLDSAKTDEIRHALEVWDIDGLTSNPKHVQKSGKPFYQVLAEIAELFAGTDKPVSVEVDPHLTDAREIVRAGVELAKISPNFVIKVGAGEAGFQAIRELTARGVRTNATLVFSVAQAWQAARGGASFVSPFLGWKEAHGDAADTLIPDIARMLTNGGYPTRIIAAAIRNSRQIAEAATAGAHCVTAGFDVYQESFRNPYTDMGNAVFGAAWDATSMERDNSHRFFAKGSVSCRERT